LWKEARLVGRESRYSTRMREMDGWNALGKLNHFHFVGCENDPHPNVFCAELAINIFKIFTQAIAGIISIGSGNFIYWRNTNAFWNKEN